MNTIYILFLLVSYVFPDMFCIARASYKIDVVKDLNLTSSVIGNTIDLLILSGSTEHLSLRFLLEKSNCSFFNVNIKEDKGKLFMLSEFSMKRSQNICTCGLLFSTALDRANFHIWNLNKSDAFSILTFGLLLGSSNSKYISDTTDIYIHDLNSCFGLIVIHDLNLAKRYSIINSIEIYTTLYKPDVYVYGIINDKEIFIKSKKSIEITGKIVSNVLIPVANELGSIAIFVSLTALNSSWDNITDINNHAYTTYGVHSNEILPLYPFGTSFVFSVGLSISAYM